MAKEKFILVSLNEDESKKLAQIVSNDTARKILDFLADKEETESDLALKLNIPISTVHYNLQALVKGRLVETEEFHYSEKGKEVLHYKLANKYIIIAPKSTFGIREKLRSILPMGLLALAGAGVIELITMLSQKSDFVTNTARDAGAQILQKTVQETAAVPAPMAAPLAASAQEAAVSQPHYALWFLLGALFCILVFIVVELIRKRKQ
jgi:DNA-binding transcriptional ArsR family regulator